MRDIQCQGAKGQTGGCGLTSLETYISCHVYIFVTIFQSMNIFWFRATMTPYDPSPCCAFEPVLCMGCVDSRSISPSLLICVWLGCLRAEFLIGKLGTSRFDGCDPCWRPMSIVAVYLWNRRATTQPNVSGNEIFKKYSPLNSAIFIIYHVVNRCLPMFPCLKKTCCMYLVQSFKYSKTTWAEHMSAAHCLFS